MEADLTVTKLEEDKFFVVATDTQKRHVEKHFTKYAPPHVRMSDVTGSYVQLNVQGPKSRTLMQRIAPEVDFSNEAFPFRHAREINVGLAKVLCIRITYLGELGYELYIPSEQAVHVYDGLVEQARGGMVKPSAAQLSTLAAAANATDGASITPPLEVPETEEREDLGLVHAGLKALASARLEKGYRDFGHDLDNLDNVLDAGLGFAVDLNKPSGFVGKSAVLEHKAAGKTFQSRIVHVLCKDPDAMMYHGEPVLRDGQPVGYMRAASYGHTVGGSVGLAKLDAQQGSRMSTRSLSRLVNGR